MKKALLTLALLLVLAPAAQAAPRDTFGVYRQCCSPSAVAGFESWLGHPVYRVHDYLADEDWTKISGAGADWFIAQWKPSPYRPKLVWSVPLPAGATLAECATGAYFSHYRALATKLVNAGMGGSFIRPLWEADGNWYRWSVTPGQEATYAACFRSIVDAMRAPGAWPKFDWTITNTSWVTSINVEAAYPGDAYVDYIGEDIYAQTQQGSSGRTRFTKALNQKWGLAWQAHFAARHGKKLSYPEWGVWAMDDPEFVRLFHAWLTAVDPGWHAYFESGSARLMDGSKPATATEVRALF